MAILEIKIDKRGLTELEQLFKAAGAKVEKALMRAVNHVGAKAYTRVVRVLATQTGAKQKAIRKYVQPHRAFSGKNAVFRIKAAAPALSLKEMDPKALKAGGVRAFAWGKRIVYPHAFILPQLGGHVFVRAGNQRVMVKGKYAGKVRQPLSKRWGPTIANEMLRGQTRQTFEQTAAEVAARLKHELQAILSGHAPS